MADDDQAGKGDKGDEVAPLADRLALSDEDHDKLPPDQQIANRDELRTFQTTVAGTATEVALKKVRDEQAAAAEQAQLDGVAAAAIKTEVDWINDLDKRRISTDPEISQKAAAEFAGNVERYQRAAAEKGKTDKQSVTREVLDTHYSELLPGAEASHEGITAYLIEHKAELNGNAFVGALRFGDAQGYERGLAEGYEKAEREGVVGKGADGASDGGNPAARDGKSRELDIDLTKRGAGRQLFRAGVEQGSRS